LLAPCARTRLRRKIREEIRLEVRERKRETPTVEEEKKKTPGEKRNRGEGWTDFPKDLCAISENCRGLSVKQNFPLILNPNEEIPKTKVGEFFKLYNIALRPKFKNSKLAFLHVNFWTKIGFELLLS
jgi:hypothetical protein